MNLANCTGRLSGMRKWFIPIMSMKVIRNALLDVTVKITNVEEDVLTDTHPSEESFIKRYRDQMTDKQLEQLISDLAEAKVNNY